MCCLEFSPAPLQNRDAEWHKVTASSCSLSIAWGFWCRSEGFLASEQFLPADAAGVCQADSYAPSEGRGLTPVCSGACAGARGHCLTQSPLGARVCASPSLPPSVLAHCARAPVCQACGGSPQSPSFSFIFPPEKRISQWTCKGDVSAYMTFMTCISCHKYKSGGILRWALTHSIKQTEA